MIDKVISKYLVDNRRLVVPQLGAFLVKGTDHVVLFSPLLTRDDGVLLHLLMEEGLSQMEAEGVISRLRFDVRYLIDNGGEYDLPTLGVFTCTDKKTLHFEYHIPKHEELQVPQEVEPEVSIEPEDQGSEAQAAEDLMVEDQIIEESLPQELPIEETMQEQVQPLEELEEPTQMEQQESAAHEERPKTSPVVEPPKYERFEPDPDLEGLSYGDRKSRSRSSQRGRARRSVDWWMVIAVSSVLLAVAVILYGFLREGARSSSPLALYEQLVEE